MLIDWSCLIFCGVSYTGQTLASAIKHPQISTEGYSVTKPDSAHSFTQSHHSHGKTMWGPADKVRGIILKALNAGLRCLCSRPGFATNQCDTE